MRPSVLAGSFLVLCGAFAGQRVAATLPPEPRPDEPNLETADYRLERKADDAIEITPDKWLLVPRLYADFDLQMDVELAADADLDLLVRQVEPRHVQGRIVPFHGRFTALRLTTGAEGAPWRTREELLFGERHHGASLAPGLVATVWISGRGRELTANVAGKPLPTVTAMDDVGTFTLIARGGKAALRRLVITNRGMERAWLVDRRTWVAFGALGGLLVLAVSRALGHRSIRTALLGLPVALVGLLVADVVHTEPLRMPDPSALCALLGGAMVFVAGLVWLFDARRLTVVVAGLAVLGGGFWWIGDTAAERLCPVDTAVLDTVFGPDAGSTLSEAHAGIVRGPFGLRGVRPPGDNGKRVMLLGGQLLYGRLRSAEEHLEPLLGGALRAALQTPVEVAALPTVDGHSAQQWALFTRFFAEGHRPNAIVLGVPAGEAAVDPATGRARSFPSNLEATVRQARAWAKANGATFVLFTESGLPVDLLDVLRAAERDGAPLVIAGADEAPAAIARRLGAVLAPLLR